MSRLSIAVAVGCVVTLGAGAAQAVETVAEQKCQAERAKAAGAYASCQQQAVAKVNTIVTGLQWEKKTNLDATTNLADRHDADNVYTWCIDGDSNLSCDNAPAADGPAFTDFLRSLNSGGCFAGQCDWRLPTRDELQTILADPFADFNPCTTPSCIDAIFGPTQAARYWSATSYAGFPSSAWYVFFDEGGVSANDKSNFFYVRGVRGGL